MQRMSFVATRMRYGSRCPWMFTGMSCTFWGHLQEDVGHAGPDHDGAEARERKVEGFAWLLDRNREPLSISTG
jgi:hypothetical protein